MRNLSVLLLVLASANACATDPASPEDIEDGIAVPDGKEDDFFSLTAAEYVVEATSTVTLEESLATADQATKDARVKELIGYKQIAIAWFLTQYLVDKEHDSANASFGGFGGMAKAGAYEDYDVTAIDATNYSFRFRQLVAGNRQLMTALPIYTNADGKRVFDLEIGRPTNSELAELETNAEWYRKAPWTDWDPSKVEAAKKEPLAMTIDREHESTDAWFDYPALLSDGVLSIDVHFGWDYHSAYHVKHAKELFSWLDQDQSFRAPVASFAQLTRTSGAFTKTIKANGKTVEVRVRLYYGKTGSETDPDTDAGGKALEADMRDSLASSDVIIYSGHSGPFYGFALANWRKTNEGDFDDSEMSTVAMPANRYQIVFAEGCDTYQIGEAFRRNPAKPNGEFIDVITTTSFSNASTAAAVEDMISRLIERDSAGNHRPKTIKTLISDLDSNSYYFHTMYGIHGIDDNPALHPYARPENLCNACARNSDCGELGNVCIGIGSSGKHCAAACADDRGCPTGYTCASVASESSRTIYTRACVPANYTCE